MSNSVLRQIATGGVSRRSFLKGSAALAAFAAVGSASVGTGLFESASAYAEEGESSSEWKPSFCTCCHYPCCATQVRVEDGVAMEIRGDENSATNQGRLCVRGLSVLHNLYSPYRVQAPMKRTNPVKGVDVDPGWVEISWDEALETVASKLAECEERDPRTILWCTGFGVEESMNYPPYFIALGTPNIIVTPGPLCPEHFNGTNLNGMMLDRLDLEHAEYVVEVGRTMGAEWCASSGAHTSHWADAYQRGMKSVVVNPVCNTSAQRGEWVPILPGTDTAFGLGVVNVMLHELDQYDEHFLKMRSNAPYLIDDKVVEILGRESHKGTYVRGADGKPLVWDTAKGAAVPFDDSMGDTYALLGEYTIDGKTYKTSLQILKDYVAPYTPEWAEEVCTVPAEKIREIANELVAHAHFGDTIEIDGYTFPYRPSVVFTGRGMASHMLGVSAGKILGTINVLLGNLDVPGGMLGTSNASWETIEANEDGILHAKALMANQAVGRDVTYPPMSLDMSNFYPMMHDSMPVIWHSILDPDKYGIDYSPEMMIIHGSDPIGASVYSEEAAEAMAKIPFVCSIALNYDLPTQFCDILLAEDSMLERDSILRVFRNEKESTDETRGLMGTLVRRPVVDKVYNTRLCEDIMAELLERVGLLPFYNTLCNHAGVYEQIAPFTKEALIPPYFMEEGVRYPWREFIDRKLMSDYGEDVLAHFDECAFLPYTISNAESYNYYHAPDNQIRLPIYYERMVSVGEQMMQQLNGFGVTVPGQDMDHIYSHYSGMPVFYEEGAGFKPTDEFPLKAVNWKIHYGVNNTASLYENAMMQDIIDMSNPYVKRIWVPAVVAEEYGVEEDDLICVESSTGGKTEGRAHVSQLIHQQCIGIPGNFGRRTAYMNPVADAGVNFNKLLTADESTMNPISMSLESSPLVKIYKIQGA